jgi:ArsR family transcriptional regulator, arsenate/arsenite/antimonite-responsive transcriptional repressor
MPVTVEVDCVAFCRALADETRQGILQMLLEGEKKVGELVEAFDTSQPTISHHLNILKSLGLVSSRREGKHVYYSIHRENVIECCGMLVARFEGDPSCD